MRYEIPCLSSCFQVYAVLATVGSGGSLPALPPPHCAARPLREPTHRRSTARLAVAPLEGRARPVALALAPVAVVLSPHGASCSSGVAARLLLSSPFWVGRCGRILAVSACGRPQLSTVARRGAEGGREGEGAMKEVVVRCGSGEGGGGSPGERGPDRRRPPVPRYPPPPPWPPPPPPSPRSPQQRQRTNNRLWPRLLRVRLRPRSLRRWHCRCPH